MKEQYQNLVDKKEAELKKFVGEFKEYHQKKKEEVHEARKELISLYQHSQRQQKLIKNALEGKYT